MRHKMVCGKYVIIIFYLLTGTQLTEGLVEPLTLCEIEREVMVRELSGGTIQHKQRSVGESEDECELVLTGFGKSAYISLQGVERRREFSVCPVRNPEIIINERSYCAKPSIYNEITRLTNGTLTFILLNQTEKGFSLDYYSNAEICNGGNSVITIPRNAAHDQLSCVIANPSRQRCSTSIRNLQGRTVMLELLYLQGASETAVFTEFNITKANPRILSNHGDMLVVTYEPQSSLNFEYVLKLTVLTCGDIPRVPNTTTDPSLDPWFSGSQANYFCIEENYEFKNTSSVTCQLDSTNQSLEWSDSSDIMCIPVSRCLKPLKVLSNTKVDQSRDNLTATYQCILAPGEVTVTCNSSDPDTVPWTWNDTNVQLNCTRVECLVADIRSNISNGNITQGNIYYHLDTLNYVCDEGYAKGATVICQGDSSWSTEPHCVIKTEHGEVVPKPLNIGAIAGSLTALTVLIIAAVITTIIWRRQRSRPSLSSSDIYESPSVNLQNLDDNHIYAKPQENVYINAHLKSENRDSSQNRQPVSGVVAPPAVYEEISAHIYANT